MENIYQVHTIRPTESLTNELRNSDPSAASSTNTTANANDCDHDYEQDQPRPRPCSSVYSRSITGETYPSANPPTHLHSTDTLPFRPDPLISATSHPSASCPLPSPLENPFATPVLLPTLPNTAAAVATGVAAATIASPQPAHSKPAVSPSESRTSSLSFACPTARTIEVSELFRRYTELEERVALLESRRVRSSVLSKRKANREREDERKERCCRFCDEELRKLWDRLDRVEWPGDVLGENVGRRQSGAGQAGRGDGCDNGRQGSAVRQREKKWRRWGDSGLRRLILGKRKTGR